MEQAKEVFRGTIKPISVYIDTKNVDLKCGVQYVIPMFHNEQMAKTVETMKDEEQAREQYVTGYFEEATKTLCKAFDEMKKATEIDEKKDVVDVVDLFDQVKKKMELLDRKPDQSQSPATGYDNASFKW